MSDHLPVAVRRNHLDFPAILAEVMDGKRPLPDYEDMHFEMVLGVIAGAPYLRAEPGIKWAVIKDTEGTKTPQRPARYFHRVTQSGSYTGDGYVLIADAKGPRLGRFRLCTHKKVLKPGQDRSRGRLGWNPGQCEYCGLDLSVDSS